MTLKEKFKQWLDTEPRYQIREVQLEIIAEEFAVGFLDWIVSEETKTLLNYLAIVGEVDESTTSKELLEIYKKEKGLQNGNY
jgi:hypothetical protein